MLLYLLGMIPAKALVVVIAKPMSYIKLMGCMSAILQDT